jgi:hypothetical protein
MEFSDMSKGDHLTCYYCGLSNEKVEAAGIWHCPNPRCTGPGGAWFRSRLSSFTEVEAGRHTVDPDEWEVAAAAYEKSEHSKTYERPPIQKPWWKFWSKL